MKALRASRRVRGAKAGVEDCSDASGRNASKEERDTALEPRVATDYCLAMTEAAVAPTSPAGWGESLARSKAQIVAGERVPLLPVLDRLRAAAEQLEAEQSTTPDGERAAAER